MHIKTNNKKITNIIKIDMKFNIYNKIMIKIYNYNNLIVILSILLKN